MSDLLIHTMLITNGIISPTGSHLRSGPRTVSKSPAIRDQLATPRTLAPALASGKQQHSLCHCSSNPGFLGAASSDPKHSGPLGGQQSSPG